jgi:hypothetical protein
MDTCDECLNIFTAKWGKVPNAVEDGAFERSDSHPARHAHGVRGLRDLAVSGLRTVPWVRH